MKLIFSLGIILHLIILITCADDCSSKTTKETCTGSCKWTAGTEATCKASTTCELNSGKSACVSTNGCQFVSSQTTPASCVSACKESDTKGDCETAGCTYNDGTSKCTEASCALNVDSTACQSNTGCTFTAASTTEAKCEATATCTLKTDNSACESNTGCTFTAAVAGKCTSNSSDGDSKNDDDNSNVLKVSFISLMLFFSLF
jgi:hypothetical protein